MVCSREIFVKIEFRMLSNNGRFYLTNGIGVLGVATSTLFRALNKEIKINNKSETNKALFEEKKERSKFD